MQFLGTSQLAEKLGVSRSRISRMAQAGEIPSLRGGSHYYVPVDAELPKRHCQSCGTELVKPANRQYWCAACSREKCRERRRNWWREKHGKGAVRAK